MTGWQGEADNDILTAVGLQMDHLLTEASGSREQAGFPRAVGHLHANAPVIFITYSPRPAGDVPDPVVPVVAPRQGIGRGWAPGAGAEAPDPRRKLPLGSRRPCWGQSNHIICYRYPVSYKE